jgi:hypothetical protein
MGIKLGMVSRANIISTAQRLQKVAESMLRIADEMETAGMEEITFPWVTVQWNAIDDVGTLGDQIDVRARSEIFAFTQNRESKGIKAIKRTVREREQKELKRSAGEIAPSQPRGRPRKNPG